MAALRTSIFALAMSLVGFTAFANAPAAEADPATTSPAATDASPAAASTAAASPAAASTAAASSLQGGWEAIAYALASGPRHTVRGRIFFTEDEWQVLFFVMDGGDPVRGSGEGGRYTFDGEELTFEHLFHFSVGEEMPGLPANPLEMTARAGEGPLEPTHVDMSEDALTLHFPSGNLMTFRRSSAP